MKNLLSVEIGRKYEKTVSLYRKKGDDKPLFSATFAGDFRMTLGRLLVACACAVGGVAALILAAKINASDETD